MTAHSAKPIIRINPHRTFSPGVTYRKLRKLTFDETVLAFQNRITTWYMAQALTGTKGHDGFLRTTMACVILDLISQYYYDPCSSNGRKFQDFLKTKIPEFNRAINPPIASYTYIRGFWHDEQIDNFAKAFWHGYRCGIIHNGMVLEYGRISWKPIANKLVTLRKREDKRGKELAVNPRSLTKRVKLIFKEYIANLRDPSEIVLRRNFVNKFQRDFGIKLTP